MESLDIPIRYVRGIGPRRAELLMRLGIETLEDALYYLPKRYEDRRRFKKISELSTSGLETILGEVIDSGVRVTPRKRMKIFELAVHDGTGVVTAKWFNQPFMQKVFKIGHKVILTGVVQTSHYSYGWEIENPEYEIIEDEEKDPIHTGRIVPIYRATEGLSPRYLRSIMKGIIDNYSSQVPEILPEDTINRYNLSPLSEAIKEAHFPDHTDIESLNQGKGIAHQRLIFDELFLLELGLVLRKVKGAIEKGISFKTDSLLVNRLRKRLTFNLTEAQEKVFEEIRTDMGLPYPMNRLLQGDVGCGKTVVALQAMLIAVENGYQAALMAPTEILSEQHYINIHRTIEELGLKVSLLTKSLKDKERNDTLRQIADGKINLVIGTHALIQEGVRFKALGLAIIDEQHRFGVIQRAALRKKGINSDILVMTATPIPRTLALTLYGDLDISVIDQLPPERRPVETRLFYESMRSKVYLKLEEEIKKGRQAYVVYPLIEESEKMDLKAASEMSESLKKIFPHRRISLIHGRIKAREREEIMDSFKGGGIDILVSTTVIEVGVDVPNATVMVVEHAERFGLAQLHQLRGRVGRGASQSYCFLMASNRLSEEARRRLQALIKTNDGFRIAEEDLSIRGPGEFFGTKQSGLPDLKVANIIKDSKTLELARKEAFLLTKEDRFLRSHRPLKNALERKWKGRLGFVLA
jgi:ATP-dependent DNA helicase RecG